MIECFKRTNSMGQAWRKGGGWIVRLCKKLSHMIIAAWQDKAARSLNDR